MQRVHVFKVPMSAPDDVEGVRALISDGHLNPEDIVALIAKTEGNGLVDDFSRPLAQLAFKHLLAKELDIEPEEVPDRIAMVMSGGCYGLMSPHVTVFAREMVEGLAPSGGEKRLAIGAGHTEEIFPEEIGRMGQIRKVAAAVRRAMVEAGISNRADVHFVQVKGPLLTSEAVARTKAQLISVVTENTADSMLYSNDSSALGVALGTDEIQESQLNDAVVRRDYSLYSSVSSTSAGIEKTRADVVLLGNSIDSIGPLRIGHSVMHDLIDVDGIRRALRDAGLQIDCDLSEQNRARVVNVFAKAVLSSSGECRGRRFTMLNDSDLGNTPGPAIVNALIASLIGDTMVYVSGGEVDSHSGPPGGNPISAIVDIE